MQNGKYLRPSDPAYEQVLDSLAMIARHTPVPLIEALLKWRERCGTLIAFSLSRSLNNEIVLDSCPYNIRLSPTCYGFCILHFLT